MNDCVFWVPRDELVKGDGFWKDLEVRASGAIGCKGHSCHRGFLKIEVEILQDGRIGLQE